MDFEESANPAMFRQLAADLKAAGMSGERPNLAAALDALENLARCQRDYMERMKLWVYPDAPRNPLPSIAGAIKEALNAHEIEGVLVAHVWLAEDRFSLAKEAVTVIRKRLGHVRLYRGEGQALRLLATARLLELGRVTAASYELAAGREILRRRIITS